MSKKRFSIIKFVTKLLDFLGVFPKYLTKFSKKTFSQSQILTLRTLKEILNLSYEDLVGFVEDFPSLQLLLQLKRIPHPTTILKYSKRIGLKSIDTAIQNSSSAQHQTVAIDATGFENHQASKHYCETINLRFSRRQYVKLSIAINTETQMICSQKARIAPANDNRDFIPVLKKIQCKKITMVCADKGYDSKKNRKFVYRKLHAWPNIPKRKTTGENYLTRMYSEKTYHQRSKVETVFSVMKKRMTSALKAKTFKTQKLELAYKSLAYNIRRLVISPEMPIKGGCQ